MNEPQIIDVTARMVEQPKRPDPVRLPSSAATVRWISKIEALLQVYEKEEAEAIAAHERILKRAQAEVDASKERVRQARMNVQAMKRILAFVEVDDQPKALPAPTPITNDGAPPFGPPRVAATAEAPDRWHQRYTACADCGTTDAVERAHYIRSRCRPCAVARWPQFGRGG